MARGIPELNRPALQEVHHRINPGRLDVRIEQAIPLSIKKRRARYEFYRIKNIRPRAWGTDLTTLALSMAEIVIERIQPQLPHVGIAIEIGAGIEVGRGIPELSRPAFQEVPQRIDPGRLDVRIGEAIPLGIEERRTRHDLAHLPFANRVPQRREKA